MTDRVRELSIALGLPDDLVEQLAALPEDRREQIEGMLEKDLKRRWRDAAQATARQKSQRTDEVLFTLGTLFWFGFGAVVFIALWAGLEQAGR